jgi:hypothetical protein
VPLRLLARAAPFVLGAVAAAIWLRRRHVERPALPVRTGAAPPPAERVRPRTGRFDRAPRGHIVTVVDDLLAAPR